MEMGAFRASCGHGPGRMSYGFWAGRFTKRLLSYEKGTIMPIT